VTVTEKVDGSSITVYYNLDNDDFGVCSRSLNLSLDCGSDDRKNRYIQAVENLGLKDKLKAYCVKYGVSLALRGELYGSSIQKSKPNYWANKELGIQFYSVWNIREMRYERDPFSPHYWETVFNQLDGIETVALLERPLHGEMKIVEMIKHYESLEKIGTIVGGKYESRMFEGVVVNTIDKSFKVINLPYDEMKG